MLRRTGGRTGLYTPPPPPTLDIQAEIRFPSPPTAVRHHPTPSWTIPNHPGRLSTSLNIQLQLHRGVRHHQVAQNAKNPIQNEIFCVFGVFFKFRFLHDCLIWVETPFPTIWEGGSWGERSGMAACFILLNGQSLYDPLDGPRFGVAAGGGRRHGIANERWSLELAL